MKEITSFNLEDLDVVEIERRLEMVAIGGGVGTGTAAEPECPSNAGGGCGALASCPQLTCGDKCYINASV